MLETMQEGTVTVAGQHHVLKKPFFVLATQNPIEQEGTYPLPKAQLDRFFFKLVVGYSSRAELATIIDRTTRGVEMTPQKVMDGVEIALAEIDSRGRARVARAGLRRAADDGHAPRKSLGFPGHEQKSAVGRQILAAADLGPGLEDACALAGRFNVSFEDVRRSYLPAMRHRVILNFEAQAEGIASDRVLLDLLEQVPEKAEESAAA